VRKRDKKPGRQRSGCKVTAQRSLDTSSVSLETSLATIASVRRLTGGKQLTIRQGQTFLFS